jgi:hypothetical protein
MTDRTPLFDRPDHPDFWVLSSVAIDYDTVIDDTAGQPDKTDQRFDEIVAGRIDRASVEYMATHRAMRVLGISNVVELAIRKKEVATVAAAWMEGAIFGIEAERRKTGRADKMPGFVPKSFTEEEPRG